MRTIALGVCACIALGSVTTATASGKKEVLVFWQKKKFSLDGPPPELAQSTVDEVRRWQRFCEQAEYSVHIDPDQRTVLFTHKTRNRAARDGRVIEKTLELFDELLPPVDELQLTEGLSPAVQDASFPVHRPTAGSPALLFDLRDERDYAAVLDSVEANEPDLAAWTLQARGGAGFVLRDLRLAAWLESAEGQEEYDPQNEMVNRLTQLAVHERFGEQPTWLAQGVAWFVESEVCDDIYCFPFRTGFVAATEHTGWDKDLKRAFKDRKDDPLRLEECAQWPRGTFQADRARIAWGIVSYLSDHAPDALPLILADMGRTWEEKRRVTYDDGRWELIAGYVLPIEHQQAVMERYAGKDFLREVGESFRLGRRYRLRK